MGVVATEELVGVAKDMESTELDLSSHLSVSSLIFLELGVTEPLPGDILTFPWPLNDEENDKSLGLSMDLLISAELFLSPFTVN